MITYTNDDLSLIKYSIFDSYNNIQLTSTRPDVVMAEAIDDRSLVYIDYLGTNETVINPVRTYKKNPILN